MPGALSRGLALLPWLSPWGWLVLGDKVDDEVGVGRGGEVFGGEAPPHQDLEGR